MNSEDYEEQLSFEAALRAEEEEENNRYDEDAAEYEFLASYAGRCSP